MTSTPNYPGGYHCQTMIVFLYKDGRQNFLVAELGDQPDRFAADRAKCLAQCVASKEVDTSDIDWPAMIQLADKVADELRGCTWDEFQRLKRAASPYSVQKGRISGQSGPARWHVVRDGKAVSGYGFKLKWQAVQHMDELEKAEELTVQRLVQERHQEQEQLAERLAARAYRATQKARALDMQDRQLSLFA